MLKNSNPKQDAFSQWSQLPQDLIRSVFKRLSLGDFERGKSVCSSWYSASRQCFPKNQIPWLILFPEDNNCCKLFNPEEKDKIYTTQDIGVDFAKSRCVATCGCWLLMMNTQRNFYIVDLLTGERINLPPVESQIGNTKLERMESGEFRFTDNTRTRITPFLLTNPHQLWVDEKNKNYVVMWSFENKYVVIYKKGDKSWKQIPGIGKCADMVYKDHKLYVSDSCLYYCGDNSNTSTIRISDFSGEPPLKASETQVTGDLFKQNLYGRGMIGYMKKMVVTVSGDVLMVAGMKRLDDENWFPEIYRINASTKEWEKVVSLGEEAMILNLGITVLAGDVEGIKKNSIYFSSPGGGRDKIFAEDKKEFFVFDLETRKIERPYQSVCLSLHYPDGRWFFPNFMRKRSDWI